MCIRDRLAEVRTAVLAAEQAAGLTDKAVALGVALVVPAAIVIGIAIAVVGVGIAEWRGGDRRRRSHGRAGYAGGDIGRPEPAVTAAVIPSIVAVLIGGAAVG